MTVADIWKKASQIYPIIGTSDVLEQRKAYVKGYQDAIKDMTDMPKDFFTSVAEGLRKLWPSGEKDGKYPWRDSVSNLVKRLEFIWKERGLKEKEYTVDDCLQAGRRYLAQFNHDARFMQTLKYFIFKQNKLVASNGRIEYVYKSTLADMLESNPKEFENFWDDALMGNAVAEQENLV